MILGEPQFTPLSAAGIGNNTVVAAQGAGVKIRVLGFVFVAVANVNFKFQSGAGGTDLTGLVTMLAGDDAKAYFSPVGWFETAANALLNLNLSAASQCSGWLVWCTST